MKAKVTRLGSASCTIVSSVPIPCLLCGVTVTPNVEHHCELVSMGPTPKLKRPRRKKSEAPRVR